jgi:cohesin loading factor subunit SCC2
MTNKFLVIKQREFQWNERQKQNEEKCKRRQQLQHEDQKFEAWNKDIIAENESFCRFTSLMDQIFDQVDESMSATTSTGEGLGILLERTQINQMRIEAQKLRRWKKLSDISPERLIKLLTIMEKNIRDSLTEEGLLAIPTRRENEVSKRFVDLSYM